MSAVCEAFGCPPSVALQQDWALVQAVFDYRNAGYAVDLLDQGASGFDKLAQSPYLTELMLGMLRAQTGDPSLSIEDALGVASARAEEADKEKDDDKETFG